ncbi:MAG: FkbM family methyltransferase [Myxococcota bacterium]
MRRLDLKSTLERPAAGLLRLAVTFLVAAATASTALAREVDFEALLEKGTSLYAREKEEPIIRHFFKGRRDGFLVDIGCFDWRDTSTTLYLEKHLGWSGIAVDAQEAFSLGWQQHRPRSKFFAYAITDESGETVTFYQAGGISSTELWNIEQWQKVVGDFEPNVVKAPTITMNDLLDREGVKKIDFLSMDINGGEPAALAGFDIKRFRPDLVMIEVHERNKEPLSAYFRANGYERIDRYLKYDVTNWYFKPAD